MDEKSNIASGDVVDGTNESGSAFVSSSSSATGNACNNAVKVLTNKVLNMVVSEINKSDMQVMIKQKIILPLINMIYTELYPYIVALIVTIIIILFLSLLTFLFFMMFYFKK